MIAGAECPRGYANRPEQAVARRGITKEAFLGHAAPTDQG